MDTMKLKMFTVTAVAAFAVCVCGAATLENEWLKVNGGGKSQYEIFRKGADKPFASFSSRTKDAALEVSLPKGSKFVLFKVIPETAKEDRRVRKV